MDDKRTHGTEAIGERNGISKLTEEKVKEIRRLRGVIPLRDISAVFGVSVSTISSIHTRNHWAWVPEESQNV